MAANSFRVGGVTPWVLLPTVLAAASGVKGFGKIPVGIPAIRLAASPSLSNSRRSKEKDSWEEIGSVIKHLLTLKLNNVYLSKVQYQTTLRLNK
jgi:hypothetical protein